MGRCKIRSLAVAVGVLAAQAWKPPSRREMLWSGAAAAAGCLPAAASGVTAPESTRVGRGMRAVGTPNESLDIDAALGIPWGGARRCDAADPACVTDGGTGERAQVYAPPALPAGRRVGAVAVLQVMIAGRDEGRLRVGLFADAPNAANVFGGLADGSYKAEDGAAKKRVIHST